MIKLLSVVIFSIYFIGLTNAIQQDGPNIHEMETKRIQCVEETGITAEAAIAVHRGEVIDRVDNSTKCYVQCFFDKLGLTDESGKIEKEPVVAYFTTLIGATRAREMVGDCSSSLNESCDAAYDMLRCYQRNRGELA